MKVAVKTNALKTNTIYLLNEINSKFPDGAMGIYRDDGLGTLSSSGPEGDRHRKTIVNIFLEHSLKVKAESLTPKVNHLDATFDMETCRYWPYRKPNSETLYIITSSKGSLIIYGLGGGK